jgi:hypothetical protein
MAWLETICLWTATHVVAVERLGNGVNCALLGAQVRHVGLHLAVELEDLG